MSDYAAMPNPATELKKALVTLSHQINRAKNGKLNLNESQKLDIVRHLRVPPKKPRLLNKNRLLAVAVIGCFYLWLIILSTMLEVDPEALNPKDARFIAAFLSKLLEWLFVTGPAAISQEVDGVTTYTLESIDIIKWIINVIIALIGWGSIISIPTLLVDNFLRHAEQRDDKIHEQLKAEAERQAWAKLHGRLEISHPSYNAFFTATYDPMVPLLIDSLETTSRDAKQWILIQSNEQSNQFESRIPDHVFMPDLSSNVDYDKLLNAHRLEGNTIILLVHKPGHKFLPDPTDVHQTDLSLSSIVVFIENIRERTQNVRFIIHGSRDLQSFSEPYRGHKELTITNLEELATEIDAEILDPDEVIIQRLFEISGGTVTSKGDAQAGDPIYIEFTGYPPRIAFFRERLAEVLKRVKSCYPLNITADPRKATGGIFYFGDDVEGIALAKKTLTIGKTKVPHYIVFEKVDRFDEVQALGFIPLCIDHENSIALIKEYFKDPKASKK